MNPPRSLQRRHSERPEGVTWGKTLRAMKSGSCSGVQGVIIAAVTAWAELNRDSLTEAIQSWIEGNGLELVETKKAVDVGRAFLRCRPATSTLMWKELSDHPILGRMLLFTFFEASDTYENATGGLSSERRVAIGRRQMRDYGDMLLAERLGQVATLHPLFSEHHKQVVRRKAQERRDEKTIDRVHAR